MLKIDLIICLDYNWNSGISPPEAIYENNDILQWGNVVETLEVKFQDHQKV